MPKQIPVYLFVGQLESGKTKFIQETMEDPNFDSGDKTLLLVCEEGEIEYDPSKFAFGGVHVAQIEDKSELTQENLTALEKKSGCGRVIIEYNGMWLIQELYDALPDNWLIYQSLATADGTTIKTYAGDSAMRSLLLDKLRGSELLVVNRAEAVNDDEPPAHPQAGAPGQPPLRHCLRVQDGSVAYDDIPTRCPSTWTRRSLRSPRSSSVYGTWTAWMTRRNMTARRSNIWLRSARPPGRQGRVCARTLCHDLLRTGHPVCGHALQVRRLQVAGAAQLDQHYGQGQRQVPPHLQGPDPDSTGPVLTAISVEPGEKPAQDVVMFS